MIHFYSKGTLVSIMIGFIISYLLVLPFYNDIRAAQFDAVSPIINHRPFPLVVKGETLLISALVGDDYSINSVTLKIITNTKEIEGNLPKLQGAERVPVQVRVLALSLSVYSLPDGGQEIGQVMQGERLNIFRVQGTNYQIRLQNGSYGYIDGSQTETIYSGYKYGAQIPIKYVTGNKFNYEIVAEDENGNVASSGRFTSHVISQEKFAELQRRNPRAFSQMGKRNKSDSQPNALSDEPSDESKKAGFPSLWMLAGLAAVGGGVALYVMTGAEETKNTNGTADIVIDW